MSRLEKALFLTNLILWAVFAVFSYAYVDLNLTISQQPLSLKFVEMMQQLGYYNRPGATLIYLALIVFAFSFFIFNLWLFYKNKIGARYLKLSTVANVFILVFAYPFLSSDLFNYLFDAKIILTYHASPYTHRPLDFPNDDWIRFMRWIHRYSPYGPFWLGASLIPAVLGFGKFILNFLMFKIFISLFHLANTYIIYKILQKINPNYSLFGTAFYSLNPLFLVEGVANAHHDVVLASFMLASVYFLIVGKTRWSYVVLLAGTLIKYIPILILPWFIARTIFHPRGGISLHLGGVLLTMTIFTYLFSSFKITVPFVSAGATQVQFQPWYLFWTLPFIALMPRISFIIIAITIAISASLRYLPYLYYGDWSHPGTTSFMQAITIIPPILVIGIILIKTKILRSEKS